MAKKLLLFIIACLLAAGCNGETPRLTGKVRAFVSILPQAYFVERVGGEHVEVEVLVEPGQSPHSYEPTPKQMVKLAGAQVYFGIGVPFEKSLIAKIEKSHGNLKIVHTAEAVEPHAAAQGHEHGRENHPEHDPHIWLNPRLVKVIAASIARAFMDIDPAHAQDYEKNLTAFQGELDELDKRIAAILGPHRGKEFYVFHPAFGHFGEAYGLKQVAVEVEGKEPSAKQLAALIEKARREDVKVIFAEPQFARSSAEAVARATGARVETIDPLARDYLKNLEDIARKIRDALPGKSDSEREE